MGTNYTNMDEHLLSLLLYYGFECTADTNYTCQICLCLDMTLQAALKNTRYNCASTTLLATWSVHERTSLCYSFPGLGNEDESLSSDLEFMDFPHEFLVYPFDFKESYDLNKYCLQMTRSHHTRPGYCLLKITGDKQVDLDSYFNDTE